MPPRSPGCALARHEQPDVTKHMSTNNSQVVVGYDRSGSAREALYRAIRLASRAPSHVLHFVNVLDSGDYYTAEQVQQATTDAIALELRAVKDADKIHFFVHTRFGKPADEILMVAREVGADLIIVGSKGLVGVEHMLVGSVAERVVREAGCTVEVARARSYNYVELLAIKDVPEHQPHYVRPHRYFYESSQVQMRPHDWPLY